MKENKEDYMPYSGPFFSEGFDAYKDNQKESDCPYGKNNKQYKKEWLDGYLVASIVGATNER